jgi:hypothetical protein
VRRVGVFQCADIHLIVAPMLAVAAAAALVS